MVAVGVGRPEASAPPAGSSGQTRGASATIANAISTMTAVGPAVENLSA